MGCAEAGARAGAGAGSGAEAGFQAVSSCADLLLLAAVTAFRRGHLAFLPSGLADALGQGLDPPELWVCGFSAPGRRGGTVRAALPQTAGGGPVFPVLSPWTSRGRGLLALFDKWGTEVRRWERSLKRPSRASGFLHASQNGVLSCESPSVSWDLLIMGFGVTRYQNCKTRGSHLVSPPQTAGKPSPRKE